MSQCMYASDSYYLNDSFKLIPLTCINVIVFPTDIQLMHECILYLSYNRHVLTFHVVNRTAYMIYGRIYTQTFFQTVL